MDSDVREYLVEQIVNAALKAGAAVMELYDSPEQMTVELKSDSSPLTEADSAAHEAIKLSLGATRIPILSEEGREMLYSERCNWELYWLVDPLDGTLEFINNNNEFTINIALMDGSGAMLSAIYVPYFRRLYIAGRGAGAALIEHIEFSEDCFQGYAAIMEQAQRLPLVGREQPNPMVAVSRSHVNEHTYAHIETLRQQHPLLEVLIQGSSYKFCLLAEGVVDYYARTSQTYEWDTAAGELILREAGGTVVAMDDGTPLKYNKEELHNPWFVARSATSRV